MVSGGIEPGRVLSISVIKSIFVFGLISFPCGADHPSAAINRHGGYEYVIAPLWKRFAAEAIDIAIIFLLKIMTTLAFIDAFEIDL